MEMQMAQNSGDAKNGKNPENRYGIGDKFGRESGKDAAVCVQKPTNGSPLLFVGMSKSALQEGTFLRRCSAGKGVVYVVNNAEPETQTIVDILEKKKLANPKKKLSRSDIEQLLKTRQLPEDRMAALANLIWGVKMARVRAVFLRMAELFAHIESECLLIKRVVFSGESFGETFFSRTADKIPIRISFLWLTRLTAIFPTVTNQVRHMFISACSCGFRASMTELRTIFPNLLTLTGYASKCPGGQTACNDLADWQGKTCKAWQKTVEPKKTRHIKGAIKMATWSEAKGYRRADPDRPLKKFLEEVQQEERIFEKCLNGINEDPVRDPEVGTAHDLFRKLMELVDMPDFQNHEKLTHYKKRLGQAKRLRYWHEIRKRFCEEYSKILISGCAVAGIEMPDHEQLTRKKVSELVAHFDTALRISSVGGADRAKLEDAFKKWNGLLELDSITIPDGWLEGEEPDLDEMTDELNNRMDFEKVDFLTP
jgi:hypothetical protein